jgi:hypothetical protein
MPAHRRYLLLVRFAVGLLLKLEIRAMVRLRGRVRHPVQIPWRDLPLTAAPSTGSEKLF